MRFATSARGFLLLFAASTGIGHGRCFGHLSCVGIINGIVRSIAYSVTINVTVATNHICNRIDRSSSALDIRSRIVDVDVNVFSHVLCHSNHLPNRLLTSFLLLLVSIDLCLLIGRRHIVGLLLIDVGGSVVILALIAFAEPEPRLLLA